MNILESVGKPVWFVLMALGFMWFWPIGLAIFVYVAWTYFNNNSHSPFTWSFWSSGNTAFDKHYQEALKALEQEKSDFAKFIEEKLTAKDQAEFAEFRSKRKS